ncbi:hypothetical protein BDV96DRAFT_650978 [Lophiotrema nucula]|uniref:Ig-like domain-containing protein n=1 Tax=Lophiotrema nucula TaxID=690887 RepID=A0A6A5YTP0_9PLEO|nr:hypothetical protein BDV96DRAFT_650978 [Lophiotrema nucula]
MSLSFRLSCITLLAIGSAARLPQAMDAVRKRQALDAPLQSITMNFTVTEQCPAPTPTSSHPPILSLVFPSPDAPPIEVTAQSQVLTSYIPAMTWCVGPPIGLVATNTLGPPYFNYSTTLYSTTVAGTGSCDTVYASTQTTVCATTLTGLASKVPITDCDQEVTFSSECGFTLETPTPTAYNVSLITPAPTLKRMMTYWIAPWQSLTKGDTPTDVDIKICTLLENDEMECISYQEVWEVQVVTSTITTQRVVDLTTTVSGPGLLLVETMHVNVTDTIQSISLSTTLMLHTEIEIETTSKSRKLVTRTESGVAPVSTLFITKKVKYKSPSTEETPTTTVLVTSTATRTSTITQTKPRLRPT